MFFKSTVLSQLLVFLNWFVERINSTIYCEEAYQCLNSNISNSDDSSASAFSIHCYGLSSCENANIIESTNGVSDHGSIECYGSFSCYKSNLITRNNSDGSSFITCMYINTNICLVLIYHISLSSIIFKVTTITY